MAIAKKRTAGRKSKRRGGRHNRRRTRSSRRGLRHNNGIRMKSSRRSQRFTFSIRSRPEDNLDNIVIIDKIIICQLSENSMLRRVITWNACEPVTTYKMSKNVS